MQLRNGKVAAPPPGQKTPKAAVPKGGKPTGVTKTKKGKKNIEPAEEEGEQDAEVSQAEEDQNAEASQAEEDRNREASQTEGSENTEKVLSARQSAQAAKKAKEAARKKRREEQEQEEQEQEQEQQEQQEQDIAPTQNPATTGPKPASDPQNRTGESHSSSLLSLMGSEQLARLEASLPNTITNTNGKQRIPFWLKPHYQQVHDRQSSPSHPAGVKKWGRYALPALGKPFWQKGRRRDNGRLELLLPMLVTEEEKKEAAKDEGGIKEKVMEFWGRDGGEGGDGEHDDDDAGNGKGGDDDPFSVSSAEEEEDVHEEEEGREEQGREEQGREEGAEASDSSSGSTQPPWSTNYPVSSDRRAELMIRQVREGKSYDVVDLGPELGDITHHRDMKDPAFLQSHHGYEEGWRGTRILGEGGEGRAGLWEKSDGDGQVIDRICIKQIGDGRDPKLRKPLEASVMEDLGKIPNNGSVRLRGYRRYPRIMAHRLYMEFCQHGDLQRLIASYREKKQYLPEEFIWDVFHHLVNACKAMDQGPSRPKDPSYTTYVHRDIKPNNIFLAAAESYGHGGIPIYPSTRMGDFGLCIPTGEQDIYHNPHELRDVGTWGYKAPEQKHDAETLTRMNEEELQKKGPNDFLPVEDYGVQDITYDWPPLGTHTNIWAVGACMYELIVLTRVTWDLMLATREGRALGKVQTHRVPEYSEPLTKLVRQCLRFDIEGRPTLEKLEKVIDARRSMFRDRWSAGEPIPHQAVLYISPDEIDNMEVGPFVTTQHIPHLERDTTL